MRRRGSFTKVLDYGCGDGFTGREVQKAFGATELVGVDTELPASACGVQRVAEGSYELARDEVTLGDRKFDLLLLCDVIEHVESDRDFMRGIAQRRLKQSSLVMVTVPAFQALFTDHDRALRHYRRYSMSTLQAAVKDSGFELLESGYLFSSLLLPRLASKVAESMRPQRDDVQHGIGSWQGGPFATRLLERALQLDNSVLLGASRLGLAIPGLSTWALCKIP